MGSHAWCLIVKLVDIFLKVIQESNFLFKIILEKFLLYEVALCHLQTAVTLFVHKN